MANLSKDIQCAGSDTRPPMLDRTDFASWQQRNRLYFRGKENGVNILKSIDEGPFQMGTVQETLAEGTEGAPHLGPEQPRVYSNLSLKEKHRVMVQNVQSRLNRGPRNNPRGGGVAGYRGAQNRVGNANPGQARQIKCYNCNDDCDMFDSDVDEAPTAQTMFMANLSSADPIYNEVGLSHDSVILSEAHDHDHYQDAVCEHHEELKMHDNYVKDNTVPGVQSNISSILNDAYMMIYNDMYEPHAQSISKTSRNIVVDNSLTAELATYKEQVELYERRAKFELTEREQKIDEQLRIIITDRIFKEEILKKELHYEKLQLASTINHNKLMVEKVTSLKNDFKQKGKKYLESFLDMKSLKEKVEDRLFKQDQVSSNNSHVV
uniref:Integrase, catalytic region, zinc finger, CCHC-type, peptidase aspartic, catalytic n=1 Tax=Tanacetum cinerariifolium TaxID=118510 RepID=A0A6L2ML32_TANCI|nr:integrase, catalytic region, zinc finger, CCHC-type, peptidase aspartic, catalytic [Tanacetum cinerariifolium]